MLNLLNRQLARQDKLTGGTASLSQPQEDEGDESDFFPVENFLEEVSDAFEMVSYSDLKKVILGGVCMQYRFRVFNPCCGSAWIWLSWIRTWIRTGNSDPDPGAWKLTKTNK